MLPYLLATILLVMVAYKLTTTIPCLRLMYGGWKISQGKPVSFRTLRMWVVGIHKFDDPKHKSSFEWFLGPAFVQRVYDEARKRRMTLWKLNATDQNDD